MKTKFNPLTARLLAEVFVQVKKEIKNKKYEKVNPQNKNINFRRTKNI